MSRNYFLMMKAETAFGQFGRVRSASVSPFARMRAKASCRGTFDNVRGICWNPSTKKAGKHDFAVGTFTRKHDRSLFFPLGRP